MQDCQAQALNAAFDCSVNGLKTMLGLIMTYEACALICKSERVKGLKAASRSTGS